MEKIMAVNAGSSSLKFQLLSMPEENVIMEGLFERIGLEKPHFKIKHDGIKEEYDVDIKNHEDAVKMLLEVIVDKHIVNKLEEITGVGHRIVHCGEFYSDSVLLNEETIKNIESCNELGSLHNPANLMGVAAFMKVLPGVANVGVFDTSFHLTMPDEAYMYAVPYEWYEKYGVRKYGFHGTSHKYVSTEAAKHLGKKPEELRLITCHMGNGVSTAAVKYGKCIDTSMGLTPLDGVPMGTRTGTFDPAVVDFICRKEHLTTEEISNILNKKSGYLGVSGVSSDSRDLQAIRDTNKRADLVLRMQAKKVVDYIGSYFVYMGGCDAIVFTAGIGENSPEARREICHRLEEALGVKINEELNNVTRGKYADITGEGSKIKVLVVPTNEELMIARDVMRLK